MPSLALVLISTPAFLMFSISSVQDVLGQPVLGNARGQHAAGDRKRLEDRRPESLEGEIVARGQARRPGADDGHFFPVQGPAFDGE